MVIAYAKGAFMPWRLVAWLGIIYTLVPVILIHIFVPESPVWLVAKGRIEDAARSLAFLYKSYPQPEHTVSDTFWLGIPEKKFLCPSSKILRNLILSTLILFDQTQPLADMHLASLQRENEARFKKNMRKCSKADFAPMQSESFRTSKWAGFLRPTGYKPMIVLFFFFLIQQFSGIYITLFYAVTFVEVNNFKSHGFELFATFECKHQLNEMGFGVYL